MNKKRNLFDDLNVKGHDDNSRSSLDIDISRIKDRVNNSISSADTERKKSYMKMNKKIISIAAAAVFVLGVTVFAASSIISGWYAVSSAEDAFDVLPTARQCEKAVGYVPVLIDTFENGYIFSEGSILDNDLRNEDGEITQTYKSVMLIYENDGDRVTFTQEKKRPEYVNEGEIVDSVNGVDIYYSSYTSKCVPTDYIMTEADKKAEESGEVIFSYGSQTVETRIVQSVTWSDNGVRGSLMQIDGKLTAKQLSEMANQAIEAR